MQPKPEGYGDDFTAKCGHCNGIQVNGIHTQGNSAKSFALAMKKTMTDILWKMYLFIFKNYSKQSLYILKKLLDC